MIFVKDEWTFYAMRFLLGIAEAGFFPGIIFYLTLWYPSSLRSTRTAWFVAAIAVSGVIGNPISGWIMDHALRRDGPGRLAVAFPRRRHPLDPRRLLGDFLSGQQHRRSEMAHARRESDCSHRTSLAEDQHEDPAQTERRLQERQSLGALRDLFHVDDRLVRHRLLAADHRQSLRHQRLSRASA